MASRTPGPRTPWGELAPAHLVFDFADGVDHNFELIFRFLDCARLQAAIRVDHALLRLKNSERLADSFFDLSFRFQNVRMNIDDTDGDFLGELRVPEDLEVGEVRVGELQIELVDRQLENARIDRLEITIANMAD